MKARKTKATWVAVGSLLITTTAGGIGMGAVRPSAPSVTRVCASATPEAAQCLADVVVHPPIAYAGTSVAGYEAAQLEGAYRLPIARGAGQTIAIVDAYDDPSAAADLAIYRRTSGLPPCTIANGCFRKLNEQGAVGPYPIADPDWGVEISLDLDMVSAACPKCHIVLVEGSSNSSLDLGVSEDTAASLGVAAISNSYGTQESNEMQQFEHY